MTSTSRISSTHASSGNGGDGHGEPPPRPDYSPQVDEEPGMQLEPPGVASEGDKASSLQPPAAPGPAPAPHPLARHLATLGLLTFASIWGTLTRVGLTALNTYSGQSITPVIWAQAVGCLVMGWTVSNKDALEGIYPPLFVMLGTGFCGSVTTFSTWVLDVFLAYGNESHWDRHGLHSVMDALTQTGATLGMSLAALSAGRALGEWASLSALLSLLGLGLDTRQQRRRPLSSKTSTALDLALFLLLGLGFWAGAALLAGLPPHENFRPTAFSITFAPPGAILRWYLSRLNSLPRSKARRPYWPLGTLAANLIATGVLAALFVAQHVGRSTGGGAHGVRTQFGCQVLTGLSDGFCGCLSTISTFAVELSSIRPRRRAVGYALGSYALGVGLCVVVVGGAWWSVGMEGSCSLA